MTEPLRLTIPLKPVSQGSLNSFGGRTMVDTHAPQLRVLRKAIKEAFEESGHPGFGDDLCETQYRFYFERPAYHYVGKKKGNELRPEAPRFHGVQPDIDKCDRAINDALTQAGVWADDCRSAAADSTKEYRESEGIEIEVRSIGPRLTSSM